MSKKSAALRLLVCILGCIRQQTQGGDPPSLLSTSEGAPGIAGPVLGFPAEEICGHTGMNPEKSVRIIKILGYLSYEKRIRELELFGLKKSRHKEFILSMCMNTLWEGVKKAQPESSQWY